MLIYNDNTHVLSVSNTDLLSSLVIILLSVAGPSPTIVEALTEQV